MSTTDPALLAAKIVQRAHVTTLHGGVGLTMARVREKFWIPRQHLFPLELSCDKENVQRDTTPLNPTASVFRPRRDAAVAVRLRMQEVAEEEVLD